MGNGIVNGVNWVCGSHHWMAQTIVEKGKLHFCLCWAGFFCFFTDAWRSWPLLVFTNKIENLEREDIYEMIVEYICNYGISNAVCYL